MAFARSDSIEYGDWVIVYHVSSSPNTRENTDHGDAHPTYPSTEPDAAHVGGGDAGQGDPVALWPLQARRHGREALGHQAGVQQRPRFCLPPQADARTLVSLRP